MAAATWTAYWKQPSVVAVAYPLARSRRRQANSAVRA